MSKIKIPCGDQTLNLYTPKIMAVLNVTPDSFSDGGNCYRDGKLDLAQAMNRVETMLSEGADIIDVGGESTRPGADAVSVSDELARVIPVVAEIRKRFDVIVSVDTSQPEVIKQAAEAGAGIINDIRALQLPGALTAAAKTGLPVCLMHMQGKPGSMQNQPEYFNPVVDVRKFLDDRTAACIQAGIARDRILLDPGFGFGKTLAHNLSLFNHLPYLGDLGLPLLVGVSRKSMIGEITGQPVDQRLHGGLALATRALMAGAKILRVHDVRATADIIQVHNALEDNLLGEDWQQF